MPNHVLAGRPLWPALHPRPLALSALVAVSALSAAALIQPSRTLPPTAAAEDPIARWLDAGPRDPVADATPLAGVLTVPQAGAPPSGDTEASANAAPPAADATGEEGLAAQAPAAHAAGDAPAPQVLPEARAQTVSLDGTATATAAGTVTPTSPPAGPAPETPTAAAAATPEAGREAPRTAAMTTPDTARAGESTKAVPSRWRDHTVRKGETLAQVLKAFGVDKEDRGKVLAAAKETPALAKLKAGQKLRAQVHDDGGLLELQLKLDPKTSVHVELKDDDYRIHEIDRPVEKRLSQTSAMIQSSLFSDGRDAGLSDAQMMELAAIFGWDIDFTLGLRPGDRFSVIYEAEYLDGQKVDNGAIVAAEFVNQGKSYRALRFEDDDGTLGYYAPDGTSKKQAFLRSPLKLARVSSGFSLSRLHPILNTRRAHKGVDYSAPIGTPVKATGSGLVTFSGQKNGYGNVVELQHGEKYSTLYGHLSRFAEGLQVGEPVKQGQVIGYVGQTGLATGPHLHYEFRVAGEHRDPLSTRLPPVLPLDGQDLAAFKKKSAPLLAHLDRMERTMVARAQ